MLNFGRARFWGVSAVCVRFLVISVPIAKIQRPSWRARQRDSSEPSHISTDPTKKSVAPQTLTEDMLRNMARPGAYPCMPPSKYQI